MRPAKAAYSEFSVTGRRRFGVKASLTVFSARPRVGLFVDGLSGAGGHGVSWPCGIAPGGLHPIGADHRLERELSRAWSRRDFQDALAASNHGERDAVPMRKPARPKDLETLDRSRGRLILPRRVKAAHSASPLSCLDDHEARRGAELRCLKYVRQPKAPIVSLIMRQIDVLSVLSPKLKGGGASSRPGADPDASHSRSIPRLG